MLFFGHIVFTFPWLLRWWLIALARLGATARAIVLVVQFVWQRGPSWCLARVFSFLGEVGIALNSVVGLRGVRTMAILLFVSELVGRNTDLRSPTIVEMIRHIAVVVSCGGGEPEGGLESTQRKDNEADS
jgi:hypothetical protein